MTALATMPRYETYKDSGIEWLGEIPDSWLLTRLGTQFSERRTKVSDIDYPPLSVTKNGILPQLDSAAKTKDGDNRKLVKAGDFVINSRSDRKGSSGVSELDGSVSLINIVLEPKGINPRFCHHLLKSYIFIEEYYRVGRGIVADLWTTRYYEMRTVMLALPSYAEQTAIAHFLDQKTAQTDAAIGIKEQQITLLKERKKILIQQAVTKGLDPTVPMKDSGVEWIGEIPAHWEVYANRVLFSERVESGREDLPLLSVSIHSGVSSEEISEEDNVRGRIKIEDKTKYLLVMPGDIAFNMMRAWQGAIGAVRTEGMVSPAYIVAKSKSHISAEYFEYQYRCPDFIKQMDRFSKGITDFRKRLYWDGFKQLYTLVPPQNEQLQIEAHIQTETERTNAGVKLLNQQIEKLREYKTTLINSVVTGKVRVTPEMAAARSL